MSPIFFPDFLRPRIFHLQYKFMAKLKPAGSSKKLPAKSARAAIPCLILVLLGIAGMCLLFYLSLQSGTS
jgi:hypothetical protein